MNNKCERIIKLMKRGYRLIYVSNYAYSGYRLASETCAEGLDEIDIFDLSPHIKQIKPLSDTLGKYAVQGEWKLRE